MIGYLGLSIGKVEFTEFQRWGQHRRDAFGRPIGQLRIVFKEPVDAFTAVLKFNQVSNDPSQSSGAKPIGANIAGKNHVLARQAPQFGRRWGDDCLPGHGQPAATKRWRRENNSLIFPDHVFYSRWLKDRREKEHNAIRGFPVDERWIVEYQRQVEHLWRGTYCGPY